MKNIIKSGTFRTLMQPEPEEPVVAGFPETLRTQLRPAFEVIGRSGRVTGSAPETGEGRLERHSADLDGCPAGGRGDIHEALGIHADDDDFWKDVWNWQTPTEDCVDGRTDVKCKGFDAWIAAWTEIKG